MSKELVKVKVLQAFEDLKEKKIRKANTEFECSQERYEELLEKLPKGYVAKVEVEVEKTETKGKSKK